MADKMNSTEKFGYRWMKADSRAFRKGLSLTAAAAAFDMMQRAVARHKNPQKLKQESFTARAALKKFCKDKVTLKANEITTSMVRSFFSSVNRTHLPREAKEAHITAINGFIYFLECNDIISGIYDRIKADGYH